MKIVINRCFGGFGLSQAAYAWLKAQGVPLRRYVQPVRGADGLFRPESSSEGEVLLQGGLSDINEIWDTWTCESRTHPLVVGVVEALGKLANGPHADLAVIEIPDGIEYTIEEYDGNEHIAEVHRTWG